MIGLAAGDYRVELAPDRGGSILRFDWRGEPLFRPACGPSVLDVACFPLVPFSNRIAEGQFRADGRTIQLRPNMPGSDHPHTLHGFGWLARWRVVTADVSAAVLEHTHDGGEWPWRYRAQQRVALDEGGLTIELSVTNLGNTPMPAGLGFHPYFPRTEATIYRGLHRGEWQNDDSCLPVSLTERSGPADWWDGLPVSGRAVDTVYTDRSGTLSIEWPERGIALAIQPGENLPHTVVFSPRDQDFFCVEPVSHMTDAHNRSHHVGGLRWLDPNEAFAVKMVLGVVPLA